MGGTQCPTPNIDSLARNGVLFRNAYSVACVCSPSRAGLLTGRYPQRIGFEANTDIGKTPNPHEVLDRSTRTFADRFKELGYATGLVGKWHLGSSAPDLLPNARGFDEFYGLLPHGIGTGDPPVPMWRNRESAPVPPDHTEAFGKEATDFIERHAQEPWFLYCAFTAVHEPCVAPSEYRKRFADVRPKTHGLYLAMLACLDDAVGDILEHLRALGLEEDTLIFLASDNGGDLPDGDNGPYRGSKWTLWEGGIRVPSLVQWRGTLPAGAVRDELTTQLDWLPTALAAAGAEVRPEWQLDGANLLPLLRGETSVAPHDSLFWRFGVQFAVRDGAWKLAKVGRDEPIRLFDLDADPSEEHDLAAEQPERVRALQELWNRWNEGNQPPLWQDPRWNGFEFVSPTPAVPNALPSSAH